MNSNGLIPIPDPIAVSWHWLQFFLLAGFFLHLILMNAMLGTAVIGLVESLRNKPLDECREKMVAKLPFIIAFTINTGIVPLLFLQVLYGNFIYTSSILMARWWLGAILVLLAAYAGAYLYQMMKAPGLRIGMLAVAVAAMLAMAFVLVNNMTLMLRPDRWSSYFANPRGHLLNISDPVFWPRYLHMLAGAVAMGGLFRAVVGDLLFRKGNHRAVVLIKSGLRWFVAGSALQVGFGFWLLLALRPEVMLLLLGGGKLATTLLVLSLVGGGLALMFAIRGRVWATVAAALATVAAMVLIRDLVRRAYLDGYFTPQQLQYTSRYGPLLFFAVFAALGTLALWYLYARFKQA